MEFALLAGIVGGIALLVKKAKANAAARNPGPQRIDTQQPGAGPSAAAGFSAFQIQQINKFTAIATIAGTATAAGVAALSSLTLAAAGPIGAAVAGVIVAIGILRGTAHLIANEWVNRVQNPFGAALAQIVNAKDAAIADGSATKAMVIQARNSVAALWSTYRQAATIFSAQGQDYRTVIDQSYETLDYRYVNGRPVGTGLITRILGDMTAQIATLPK